MRQSTQGAWIASDTIALTADIALTLTDTFTVRRKSLGAGSALGPNETYADVVGLTDLAGAISDQKGPVSSLDEGQERITSASFFEIHLSPTVFDSIVLSTDRVRHEDTGIEYELIAILAPSTEMVATRLTVAKVNQ